MIVSARGGLADTLTADTRPAGPPGLTLVGYARCSTDKQDLAAQRAALEPVVDRRVVSLQLLDDLALDRSVVLTERVRVEEEHPDVDVTLER